MHNPKVGIVHHTGLDLTCSFQILAVAFLKKAAENKAKTKLELRKMPTSGPARLHWWKHFVSNTTSEKQLAGWHCLLCMFHVL